MAFVDIPLTGAVRAAVERAWGIPVDGDGERLPGGEESASYLLGGEVVRIGPAWRGSAELEWSYGIAARAGVDVPEVIAPRPHGAGGYVLRVGGRPVSVWPYARGSWADHGDSGQGERVARLLARLHRTLARLAVPGPRPGVADLDWLTVPQPEVTDPHLDRWLAEFMERRTARQPLHGDVYRGNVLVRDGEIVALVDWDDVFLGPPEQELAWAAAEWGQVRKFRDLAAARPFVDAYARAGGTADRIGDEELAQLVRGRIRMEVNYSHATGEWGASDDEEDREYEANQLATFRALRP